MTLRGTASTLVRMRVHEEVSWNLRSAALKIPGYKWFTTRFLNIRPGHEIAKKCSWLPSAELWVEGLEALNNIVRAIFLAESLRPGVESLICQNFNDTTVRC